MADALNSGFLYAPRDPDQSDNILALAREFNVGGGHTFSSAGGGDNDLVYMDAVELYYDAEITPFFTEDWYYRIHLIPAQLDLGNLLSTQERTVHVWNAFFNDVSVTAFAVGGDDTGIDVTEPDTPTYTIPALNLSSYPIAVSSDGPPTINASLDWTIDSSDYSVPVTGRRVVLWPFSPQWSDSVDETLEWKTSIETSRNGTEQRFALRKSPRRIHEYNMLLEDNDVQIADSLLFGWAGRLYALPLWQEHSGLASNAAVDDTEITLDTDDRTFPEDGVIVLYADSETYETAEIETNNGGSLTLKNGLSNAWPAGTRVFPVLVSALDPNVTTARPTDRTMQTVMRFVGNPTQTDPNLPVAAAPATYLGEELYLQEPNWAGGISLDYDSTHGMFDNTIGAFQINRKQEWPLVMKQHRWLLDGLSEVTALREFLQRRDGRRVPVWMPSGVTDFDLVAPITDSASVIKVRPNGSNQFVYGNPARSHLLIRLKDGTVFARAISLSTVFDSTETHISIDSPLGVAVDPSEVKRISYLGLYRLATDNVTFPWRTNGVTTLETTFQLTVPT